MSTNKSSMLFPYIKCTRGIEMLLVRDHNAGLCSDGYCTWYSEAGSLEALYPHLLHFGPGPETDITSLQTAQELCEVAQQVPLHLYCISRRLLLDVRQNSTVAVPVAVTRVACNQSCSTVSRAAVPLMRTRLLAVGSDFLAASPECSSHCSETLRSLP